MLYLTRIQGNFNQYKQGNIGGFEMGIINNWLELSLLIAEKIGIELSMSIWKYDQNLLISLICSSELYKFLLLMIENKEIIALRLSREIVDEETERMKYFTEHTPKYSGT